MFGFTIIIILRAFQNYDEMIKNYAGQAVVIFKTEPDLGHLADRLQQ